MHKNPKGLQSTRSNVKAQQYARLDLKDMNPQQELWNIQEQNVFCFESLADTVNGTVYMDLPGRFTVRSIRNMQYILVCYAYDSNAIIVCSMKSCNDQCMVAAHKYIYNHLTAAGHKPKLNATDNECSKVIQNYIMSQNVDWQLVEPGLPP